MEGEKETAEKGECKSPPETYLRTRIVLKIALRVHNLGPESAWILSSLHGPLIARANFITALTALPPLYNGEDIPLCDKIIRNLLPFNLKRPVLSDSPEQNAII